MDGDPRDRRRPDQRALLEDRPAQATCRHRHQGDVPGRLGTEGRRLDHGHLPEGRRGLPQGWCALRDRFRHDLRLGRHLRQLLPRFRRQPGRCQGQHRCQLRPDQAGARIPEEADCLPAAGCAGLGRCVEQQVAGLGQGRDDHEPAQRLGGGQARRAADCRATVDPRLPGRSQGQVRAFPAVLLGHLELRQEQAGCQEPAAPSVNPSSRRENG